MTDFVLVAFPMLAIFSATVSISMASYAKLVLLDATIEGARYAALADQDISSGIEKAKDLVARSLGNSVTVDVQGENYRIGQLESIRLISSIGLTIAPGSKLITASSVATREIEY